jgi:hypothetical protein
VLILGAVYGLCNEESHANAELWYGKRGFEDGVGVVDYGRKRQRHGGVVGNLVVVKSECLHHAQAVD